MYVLMVGIDESDLKIVARIIEAAIWYTAAEQVEISVSSSSD